MGLKNEYHFFLKPISHLPKQLEKFEINDFILYKKNIMENLTDIGVNMCCKHYNKKHDIVIQNAKDSNVKNIITISNSLKECKENIKLCKQFTITIENNENENKDDNFNLKCTVGVHPHNAKQLHHTNFGVIKEIIQQNKTHVVAIGECGLDYNRMFSPQKVQLKWFEEQIKLSLELDLPLYFHERDAHSDFIKTVTKYKGRIRGVVHCFTGSKDALLDYLKLGFYIGITGWVCDEKRGKRLQSLIHLIPKNRILLETDSPFLTPHSLNPRPKYNEPKNIPIILKRVAGLMRISPKKLVEHVTNNRKTLFGF